MSEDLLKTLAETLQTEANEKIKEAIQLFIRSDMNMRLVTLNATGFSGIITAKSLRDHFDNLELMDLLDDVIFNLKDDIEND